MDPTFIQNSIETDFKSGLKIVRDLFQTLNVGADQNPQATAALDSLTQLLGEPTDSFQTEIENFRFETPTMSFNDLVTLLGTVHPEHGKHFTERKHVLHYNAQPNSYNIKNPEEEALKAREALLLQNAQATEKLS
jgi:hypothetical protein